MATCPRLALRGRVPGSTRTCGDVLGPELLLMALSQCLLPGVPEPPVVMTSGAAQGGCLKAKPGRRTGAPSAPRQPGGRCTGACTGSQVLWGSLCCCGEMLGTQPGNQGPCRLWGPRGSCQPETLRWGSEATPHPSCPGLSHQVFQQDPKFGDG